MISDPEREPVLERAMPADAVPGSTVPEDSDAEVLLRDGSWVLARVIGQRKDRHGRWAVGIRWYASSAVGGREGWFLYSTSGIRRPAPLAAEPPDPDRRPRPARPPTLKPRESPGQRCPRPQDQAEGQDQDQEAQKPGRAMSALKADASMI